MRGALRTGRRQRQAHVFTALNLTALIDLFTILVLFLLFNMAGGADVLPPEGKLQLPQSLSEKTLQATVTIMITSDEITVEGKIVGGIQAVLAEPDLEISALKKELVRHADNARALGAAMGQEVFEGKVTILGDQGIPFRLIEKVMFTCSQAEFSDIRLAVIQKESA